MKGLPEEAPWPGSQPRGLVTLPRQDETSRSCLCARGSASYTWGLDTTCDKVTHAQQSMEQQPSRLPAALCGDGSTV